MTTLAAHGQPDRAPGFGAESVADIDAHPRPGYRDYLIGQLACKTGGYRAATMQALHDGTLRLDRSHRTVLLRRRWGSAGRRVAGRPSASAEGRVFGDRLPSL